MERERVVFFFPWREVSGGPPYLSSLANDLARDDNYEVWYIDYEPGLSDSMIDKTKVKKIVFTEPFVFPIQEPITLITPIYCASFIPKLHPYSKILFLNWHNYCIQALLNIWRLSDKNLQKFLKRVCERDAVFFLDRTHLMAQNEWIEPTGQFQFAEYYVPPKVIPARIRCKQQLISDSEINVAVLGRLCTDKIFSILNLLRQLEVLDDSRVKNVYVIGSGEESARITEKEWNNNIAVHLEGTITGEELSEFLAQKVDILFSMGMSVLEGARIGLPSVIMAHNVQPFDLDAYAYLNDSKGYAIGWYNTQIASIGIEMHTLAEVLKDIYGDGKKSTIGQQALEYLIKNHASNVDKLKERITATELRFDEFEKFATKQGYVKVLGIPVARLKMTFDCSEKSVSLFGMDSILRCRISPQKKEVLLFGKPQKWIVLKKDEDDGKYCVFVRVPLIKA